MQVACRASTGLRYRRQLGDVFLYAFELIELDGDDLRREPIERRKAALALGPMPECCKAMFRLSRSEDLVS